MIYWENNQLWYLQGKNLENCWGMGDGCLEMTRETRQIQFKVMSASFNPSRGQVKPLFDTDHWEKKWNKNRFSWEMLPADVSYEVKDIFCIAFGLYFFRNQNRVLKKLMFFWDPLVLNYREREKIMTWWTRYGTSPFSSYFLSHQKSGKK